MGWEGACLHGGPLDSEFCAKHVGVGFGISSSDHFDATLGAFISCVGRAAVQRGWRSRMHGSSALPLCITLAKITMHDVGAQRIW